jgi:hypothetical protein
MRRFVPFTSAVAAMSCLASAAHSQGTLPTGVPSSDSKALMACMQDARTQTVAEAEVGAFIRDCLVKKHGGSFGAPKDAAASVPPPPGCADKNVLDKVRGQYQIADQTTGEKLAEIDGVREVLLGPPPRSANQYATATTFIAISRYCEGTAKLASGLSESVYWRIDQVKDGPETDTRIDHCSERHDAFQNGCAHMIAGKEK